MLERDDQPGPWAGALKGDSVCRRRVTRELEVPEEISSRRYTVLGTKDIWLGYAGRKEDSNPIHEALRRLETGDEVRLRQQQLAPPKATSLPCCSATPDAGYSAGSFRDPRTASRLGPNWGARSTRS